MPERVTLIGGPADGELVGRPRDADMIAIPLDEQLNALKDRTGKCYAHAIYGQSPNPAHYIFRGAQRENPSDSFEVPFVDGPMKGTHRLRQAVQLTDMTLGFPLNSNGNPLERGDSVASIAQYKSVNIDGVWKMALVRIVDAPKETSEFAHLLSAYTLTEQLAIFTVQQLVEELVKRPGFIGVIAMHPDELPGQRRLDPGAKLVLCYGPQLNLHNVKQILRDALKALSD
jgi:hypothetical protein